MITVMPSPRTSAEQPTGAADVPKPLHYERLPLSRFQLFPISHNNRQQHNILMTTIGPQSDLHTSFNIQEVVDSLKKLALPHNLKKRYCLPGGIYLALSSPQEAAVKSALETWCSSVLKISVPQSGLPFQNQDQLFQWLGKRYHTLQTALNQHKALHFDVLILGLVSSSPLL